MSVRPGAGAGRLVGTWIWAEHGLPASPESRGTEGAPSELGDKWLWAKMRDGKMVVVVDTASSLGAWVQPYHIP